MKKLITTCVLLTSISVVSFAQSKQAGTTMSMDAKTAPAKTAVKQTAAPAKNASVEAKADKIAKDLQKEYKLTDEQTRNISDAERDFVMQEQELKKNNVPADAGPYQQMRIMRNDRYRSIMTQEQYSKYEQKMKTAPKN